MGNKCQLDRCVNLTGQVLNNFRKLGVSVSNTSQAWKSTVNRLKWRLMMRAAGQCVSNVIRHLVCFIADSVASTR